MVMARPMFLVECMFNFWDFMNDLYGRTLFNLCFEKQRKTATSPGSRIFGVMVVNRIAAIFQIDFILVSLILDEPRAFRFVYPRYSLDDLLSAPSSSNYSVTIVISSTLRPLYIYAFPWADNG